MKKLIIALIAITLFSCTKEVNKNFVEASKKAKGHNTLVAEATTATVTITNNGGGSFSIDYGGATDVVWMFFRWGDSLSVSGNVIPTASQSFYLNPVTTFTANGSGLYYQAVMVTGSTVRGANGILGADWITTYSNVIQ